MMVNVFQSNFGTENKLSKPGARSMNPEMFAAPKAGRIVRTPRGDNAFVPAPLPPEIPYDGEMVLALARSAVGQLQAAGILLEVTGRE